MLISGGIYLPQICVYVFDPFMDIQRPESKIIFARNQKKYMYVENTGIKKYKCIGKMGKYLYTRRLKIEGLQGPLLS